MDQIKEFISILYLHLPMPIEKKKNMQVTMPRAWANRLGARASKYDAIAMRSPTIIL